MKLPLSRSGYLLNPKTNVWSRPDYIGIAYSDGDEVEQRIAAVIEQAIDLTVLSTELRQHCIDWPSLYHLTSARANILRPFELSLHGSILEIGAGCGAITRYLGECGGNVLALEGSSRRAAIARSRTRDLENVTVVADSFERFQCEQQFDVITLIGVLEYANLFISHGNPPLSMLQRVRSLLKLNGKLIIAIENQLGLKYFAGAPEDHFGQPMYGIEGRYKTDQPQTYGRKVLTQMLKQAGFAYSEFMAPFPDYKLPVSIITESGFSYEGFDAGALAWQSVKRDPQLPQVLVFSPELAWPTMIENGLGLDCSNSFLVEARINANQKADSSILAWHFTSERWKEFCKETKFLRNVDGSIETHYYPLLPGSARHATGQLLTCNIPEKSEYVQGRPLSQELIRIVTRDGWRLADVSDFLRRYLEFLVSYESAKGILVQISSPESQIPGEYFDIIPQNIIIGHDGKWHVIDKEWALNKEGNIAVGWLLFRSLLPLMNSVTRFGICADEFINTAFGLTEAIFKTIGFAVSEEKISSYARQEIAVQEDVSRRGQDVNQQINWWRISLLQKLNLNQTLAERDAQIAGLHQTILQKLNLNQTLAERDAQIAGLHQTILQKLNLNQTLAERDAQIAGLHQTMAERNTQIAGLHQTMAERNTQIAGLHQTMAERDAQISHLHLKIQQMQRGIAMQLLERYRRVIEKLLPQGTRRRYCYKLGLSSIRVILGEGWRSFLLKSWKWILMNLVYKNINRIKNVFRKYLFSSFGLKKTKITTGRKRIKIAAVTMVYNEAFMLPYFLRHYQYLDEIHVLYETDSTDESLEILNRARNIVIRKCHIEGGLDDIEKINLITNTLHGIDADWAYLLDPDEFIFPPNESPYDFLKRQNCDVVRLTMFQVYRHRTDKDLDPLLPPVPQRIHGEPDLLSTVRESNRAANSVYVKPNVVRPSSTVRFYPGHHEIMGTPQVSPESYIGAHWHMADPSIAVRKRMERKARISERNKANELGWQNYNVTKNGIKAECERHLDDPIIDALRSYSEVRLPKSLSKT